MYKKIDLENHFYDISAMDALAARKDYPYFDRESDVIHWSAQVPMKQGKILEDLLEIAEKRLGLMDKWGIDVAVISSAPGIEELDTEASIQVSKAHNDAMYALSQKYPGRFLGSAALPTKDVAAACAELERCVKEYGFVAWHSHSNFGHAYPDDEQFWPIYKKCEELGVYVYLHPQLPNTPRTDGFGFGFAGPAWGFTMDTVTSIMRMILSGLFDEMPKLKVVLGHLGEAIPFLLDRIDNRLVLIKSPLTKNQHSVRYYFKNNIWVTTSGNMSKEAFKCTMDVLGMDHITIGTDYPFEVFDEMMEFIESLPLNPEQRDMLNSKNAIDFLGIKI